MMAHHFFECRKGSGLGGGQKRNLFIGKSSFNHADLINSTYIYFVH